MKAAKFKVGDSVLGEEWCKGKVKEVSYLCADFAGDDNDGPLFKRGWIYLVEYEATVNGKVRVEEDFFHEDDLVSVSEAASVSTDQLYQNYGKH